MFSQGTNDQLFTALRRNFNVIKKTTTALDFENLSKITINNDNQNNISNKPQDDIGSISIDICITCSIDTPKENALLHQKLRGKK